MDERNLPTLLRTAERRVNQHIWGDRRALVSIPARPDEDVDLLLMEAAETIEHLRGALETLWPGLVLDLRYAGDDDDKDAMAARIQTVQEALAWKGAHSASTNEEKP